mgnify:FL=1
MNLFLVKVTQEQQQYFLLNILEHLVFLQLMLSLLKIPGILEMH